MAQGIITGQTLAGSDVTLLARLRGTAGALVTQASLSAITYQVSDLTAGTVAGSGTLTISSVIFDSLQQSDPRWTRDSASALGPDGSYGYNFAATIAASVFATSTLAAPGLSGVSAHTFQVDVKLTDTSGGVWRVSWQVTPTPVYA